MKKLLVLTEDVDDVVCAVTIRQWQRYASDKEVDA